jgi:hypothetical protein
MNNTLILTLLNLALIGCVVFILFFRKNPQENKLLSDLEGIDLLEFQQNLKSLIDELNVVANTNILGMEDKKKQVEEIIKSADARINEMKYLIERNQLRRQAEYKEAISEVQEEPAKHHEIIAEPSNSNGREKETVFVSKLVATGLEELEEDPRPEHKAAGRDKYQHINSLIKNGLSVDEIAKVTGLTRGEIELVRNIKR